MSQSRKLAEQMRPFLRAMEQSINDVRRQRTGENQPAPAEPDAPEPTATGEPQTPCGPAAQSDPPRQPMPAAPNPNRTPPREPDVKPNTVHNASDGRPLSYDGSGIQDDDDERPRLKARPKRSSSFNQSTRPDQTPCDVHSRAG